MRWGAWLVMQWWGFFSHAVVGIIVTWCEWGVFSHVVVVCGGV